MIQALQAPRLRKLQAGETLFLEGDTPQALYQVREGFAKLTWTTPSGRDTISELLLPGDVFDLPSCLDGRPYPFSCKAPILGGSLVASVPRQQLLEDSELALRCQARLVQQLRQQRCLHVATAAERVEVRISRALLWLASRLGSSATVPFPLTRQEIAEWVGTTTETVIRVCSALRRQGLIEFGKGSMTLLQVSELTRISEAA